MYIVSDCVICGHRKSTRIKFNCTKPDNCEICGTKIPSFLKISLNKILVG